MASIYIDHQSGNWKLKTKLNGKDKRITLRKALDGETNAIKPADVLSLAAKHDAVFNSKERGTATATATANPNPDSMMEFMDWFLVEYPKNKTKGTAIKMERIVRYFREFLGKDCPVASVTSDMVKTWAEQRLADPKVGGTTVKSDLIYLSALFRYAMDEDNDRDFIVKNPVSRTLKDFKQRFPYNAENVKSLTDDQAKAFLEQVDNMVANGKLRLDFADLFRVMLATGMRVSAATHMRWDWITPDWTIRIPATETGEDCVATKTKTGYTAAISDIGLDVLKRRRKDFGSTGRVFPDLTYDAVYFQLTRKFDGIHPHQLRHTFGTALSEAEKTVQEIMACMGQRDLKTTMCYITIRDKAKQRAVAALPW